MPLPLFYLCCIIIMTINSIHLPGRQFLTEQLSGVLPDAKSKVREKYKKTTSVYVFNSLIDFEYFLQAEMLYLRPQNCTQSFQALALVPRASPSVADK